MLWTLDPVKSVSDGPTKVCSANARNHWSTSRRSFASASSADPVRLKSLAVAMAAEKSSASRFFVSSQFQR
ncbi:hypothetical protein D3C83_170560 [compost metagenome]